MIAIPVIYDVDLFKERRITDRRKSEGEGWKKAGEESEYEEFMESTSQGSPVWKSEVKR